MFGSPISVFNLKWVGKQLRNSYTTGRFLEEIMVKKHIKQGQGHEGGIFTVEAPLHVSTVQVLDPVTGRPCKVGIRYLEDGAKARVSRGIGTSRSIIPRPEILKMRTTPRPTVVVALYAIAEIAFSNSQENTEVFFICEL
ncbi:unnamed protein product [Camellia sinensis]